MRRRLFGIAVVALALAPVAAELDAPTSATASARYRRWGYRVAPGLTYTRIIDSWGPKRVHVLKADLATALTLDVELANDRIPGHETTSSMAARRQAVAGINGDFTILPGAHGAGRPVNTFVEDGLLVSSPLIWGRNFSVSKDETAISIGHSRLRMSLTRRLSGEVWRVTSWNEAVPKPSGIAAHTPLGGAELRPPERSCSARIYSRGAVTWDLSGGGLEQASVVDAVRCAPRRMWRKGGTVVSAPQGAVEAALIASLVAGEEVAVGWSLARTGVLDTIGGNPTLLEDGELVVEPCAGSYFCDRNPRTGIGVTADGRILLVVVDGRRPGYSVGMTPVAFGKLFQRLGATWALNLDGGGSSTMVVEGRIVNRPSDGTERPVGSSILLLQGPDPREPAPASYQPDQPLAAAASPLVSALRPPGGGVAPGSSPVAPLPSAARARCSWLRDPASTGGMLDSLARGDLGEPGRLPPSLRRALDVYRGRAACPPPAKGEAETQR